MNPQYSLCLCLYDSHCHPIITVIHGELLFRLQYSTPRHGPELITALVVCFASSIRRIQLAIAQMAYLVDLLSLPGLYMLRLGDEYILEQPITWSRLPLQGSLLHRLSVPIGTNTSSSICNWRVQPRRAIVSFSSVCSIICALIYISPMMK